MKKEKMTKLVSLSFSLSLSLSLPLFLSLSFSPVFLSLQLTHRKPEASP